MENIRKVAEIILPEGPAYISRELREKLNPFVLFDAGIVETDQPRWGLDWHPHSGVATLTFPFLGDLHHADSGNNQGVIKEGGFQWMQAGSGIWHKEIYEPNDGKIGIQQLWVRLGPNEELAPNTYFDTQPTEIPAEGNVRVLVGSYKNTRASHEVPADITYLDVSLRAGETWSFTPPATQSRGFVYPRSGELSLSDTTVKAFEMALLADSSDKVVITAQTDTQFVIALAKPGEYPLVSQYGQVHTRSEALVEARQVIANEKNKIQSIEEKS